MNKIDNLFQSCNIEKRRRSSFLEIRTIEKGVNMKSGGERGEEYFNHFYRIWKVGPSVKDRLVFWKTNFFFKFTTGGADTDQEQVDGYEHIHLSEKGIVDDDWVEIPGAVYPDPRRIYAEKYYWDHGVVTDPAGRLRYFKSNFSELMEVNKTDHYTPEELLYNFEMWVIFCGHEHEICTVNPYS